MITLTDTAAVKVKELIDAEGERRSGAARRRAARRLLGLQLRDVLRHRRGRRRHHRRLRRRARSWSTRRAPSSSTGATLDYKDGLQQAGFSINNPNAQRTCGCGQSFS